MGAVHDLAQYGSPDRWTGSVPESRTVKTHAERRGRIVVTAAVTATGRSAIMMQYTAMRVPRRRGATIASVNSIDELDGQVGHSLLQPPMDSRKRAMTESIESADLAAATERTGQLFALLSSQEGTLDDIASSYTEIEQELQTAGYDLKGFLPADEAERLNFDAPAWATRFFKSYGRVVRAAVCDKTSDLRANIAAAMTAGTTSLLTALAISLAIPAAAIIVLAPIAATLLALGLDAFCSMDA